MSNWSRRSNGILSPPPVEQKSSEFMDISLEDGPSCSSSKNRSQPPTCISPDLFSTSSTEDEEEQKVSNFQVALIEPVKEIVLTRNKTANLIANAEKFMIKLLKDLVTNGTASITVVNYRSWENSETSNGM